jgi:hypothetical protein
LFQGAVDQADHLLWQEPEGSPSPRDSPSSNLAAYRLLAQIMKFWEQYNYIYNPLVKTMQTLLTVRASSGSSSTCVRSFPLIALVHVAGSSAQGG